MAAYDSDMACYRTAAKIPAASHAGAVFVPRDMRRRDADEVPYLDVADFLAHRKRTGVRGLPPFLWAASRVELDLWAQVEIGLEVCGQTHGEEAVRAIPEGMTAELEAFVRGWSKRTGVATWVADRTRAVVLEGEG